MPLYEYQCADCSKIFEVRHGFHDEVEIECPDCHGKSKRMFSPVTVIYKGSGFYTTDNRTGGPPPASKKAEETKPEKPKAEAVKSDTTRTEKPKAEASAKPLDTTTRKESK